MLFVCRRLLLFRVDLIGIAFGDALRDWSDGFRVVAVGWVERMCHYIILGWATQSCGNPVDDFFVGVFSGRWIPCCMLVKGNMDSFGQRLTAYG